MIDQALKDKMKEQRLNQYKQQMFTLEMDVAALTAIGDTEGVETTQKYLDSIKKAFAAVEVI